MPQFSDFIVFADEGGDHSLTSIHRDYPMFVLALCLFAKEDCAGSTVPAVLRFKFRHFGHDQVVLREHDIRKTKGAFRFLFEAERRPGFYADLSAVVEAARFTVIASVIHKERYRAQCRSPGNPYHVALGAGLEQAFLHLHGMGCRRGTTYMLFERRGAREDAEMEVEFRRVCEGANPSRTRFPFGIVFADKKSNSTGLQVADLVARPIGRRVLAPDQPNRAFDILAGKLGRGPGGGVLGWGLKQFP